MAADAALRGVRGILGGVRAPAALKVLVQRQAQLASKLDPAVNQALAASTAQAAGSGLSAARRCGRVRPCASTARSRSGNQRLGHSPASACARKCPATPPAPACAHRGRGGHERPVVPSRRARAHGSPVGCRTAISRAVAWGMRVGILAWGESRS